MKQRADAWEFIRHMREEWTEEDWSDFYHAVDGALKRIAKRHSAPCPQCGTVGEHFCPADVARE